MNSIKTGRKMIDQQLIKVDNVAINLMLNEMLKIDSFLRINIL